MSRVRAVLALTCTAALAPPLAGQTPLRLGQPVTARLTPADATFDDRSHYKLYVFSGSQGDTITAELASDDFDAMLVLTDASGNRLAADDDGGERCNAQLTFVLPAAANYRLYANSSAPHELGEYRLLLALGGRPAPADRACRGFGPVAGRIEVGDTATGTLTTEDNALSDSTYFQRWILPVQAQRTFTVDLESTDFDAFLMLTRGRGDELVRNDDGGNGCNARVVYTATDDRPLRVIVNTASRPPRQVGRFTLRVTAGELPPEPKGNCRPGNVQTAASPTIRELRVGQPVTGTLAASDELYADTTYYQRWQLRAIAHDTVTIDLSSDEFDPVLIVRGADLDASLVNDDGGPGCGARVTHAFPSAGPYTVLVNSTSDPYRQTGRFVLSVTRGSQPVLRDDDCRPPQRRTRQPGAAAAPAPAAATGDRRIVVGETRQGQLTASDVLLRDDATYAQAWSLRGERGQTITVDLESAAFDAYVFVRGPGLDSPPQDDDSGGSCNARLTVTFPERGEYEIVVNTRNARATGAFTLSVIQGAKPASLARCNPPQ